MQAAAAIQPNAGQAFRCKLGRCYYIQDETMNLSSLKDYRVLPVVTAVDAER